MDRYEQLVEALSADDIESLIDYMECGRYSDIKRDLLKLAESKMTIQSPSDLKAFTMAAMQGLLANPEFLKKPGINFQEHKNQSSEAIAMTAINVAKTTLFYLQKQQS